MTTRVCVCVRVRMFCLCIAAVKLSVTWAMAVACQPVLGSSTVACGGLDNVCSLYDMNMGSAKRAQLDGHEGYVSAVRFLTPSSLLTSSGDSTCILWDVSLGREVIRFTDHASDVLCISPCPTSAHTFVSGSVDSTAKVWDTRTGRSVQSFVGHDGDVNAVRFMRNGLAFGTGGDDSVSKIFDLRSCARVNEFANEAVVTSVTSGDFSASGRIWFSGHDDFNVYAWDTLEENPLAPLYSMKEHSFRVSSLAVNQPGTALCTGSWDTRIRVRGGRTCARGKANSGPRAELPIACTGLRAFLYAWTDALCACTRVTLCARACVQVWA